MMGNIFFTAIAALFISSMVIEIPGVINATSGKDFNIAHKRYFITKPLSTVYIFYFLYYLVLL